MMENQVRLWMILWRQSRINLLEQQIKVIRSLHSNEDGTCDECYQPWPCRTRKAANKALES